MVLSTNVSDLATAIATALKSTRVLVNNNATDLAALDTTAKSNLVLAINEVKGVADAAAGGGVSIDDTQVRLDATWSSDKIDSEITSATSGLAAIDDVTPSTSTAWSSSKTASEINASVSGLVDAAPGTLDTLNELAAAIGDDANYAATTTTALGNRVRADAAQAFDSTQQGQARTNIGAASATALTNLTSAVGNTDADFAATFEAGLL